MAKGKDSRLNKLQRALRQRGSQLPPDLHRLAQATYGDDDTLSHAACLAALPEYVDAELAGERVTEADWRLFTTLVRFDAVYYGHFKCNLRRILDYPNLDGYLRDLYQQPGIRETVNFDHIKRHYYFTHDEINPTRIVPLGPVLDLEHPHGRERVA